MMFSKSCEYALRAVIYLCIEENGVKMNIKEISSKIGSPEPFTAKILQTLARHGVISSQKGPGGGFYIDADSEPIKVIDVIGAIDGKDSFDKCGMGLNTCNDSHPCPIHDEYKLCTGKLKELVTNKTVSELAQGVKSGKYHLNSIQAMQIAMAS